MNPARQGAKAVLARNRLCTLNSALLCEQVLVQQRGPKRLLLTHCHCTSSARQQSSVKGGPRQSRGGSRGPPGATPSPPAAAGLLPHPGLPPPAHMSASTDCWWQSVHTLFLISWTSFGLVFSGTNRLGTAEAGVLCPSSLVHCNSKDS